MYLNIYSAGGAQILSGYNQIDLQLNYTELLKQIFGTNSGMGTCEKSKCIVTFCIIRDCLFIWSFVDFVRRF